ncbi:MAG TPA: VCBS repeat-containing protein, partial [Planctomycetota bacterium]|nr:VCBS repeat-containing protein [Planctomycetota bacterium]
MLLLVPRAFAAEWVHLSSARGEIPTPNDDGAEQVNALIFDVDLDGRNDFVVGERRGAPGVVWFRRDSDSFTRFPIEMNQADVTSSAAFYDLDRDGDLDVIMGGSHLSDEIWWWENPFPEYDASTPWTRHTIKRSGGKQHHDIIIGDFDSDGADELAFWSLVPEHELHIGKIPDDPRAGPWSFSLVHSTGDQYSEGLVSVDVDLDGRLDVVAGGYWLKHTSDLSFDAHEIAPSRSHARVAAGDIVTGGRPEVVFVDGHGKGPLEWHEWSEEAEAWIAHALVEEVERGHSL